MRASSNTKFLTNLYNYDIKSFISYIYTPLPLYIQYIYTVTVEFHNSFSFTLPLSSIKHFLGFEPVKRYLQGYREMF